jgi:inositol transporter-like SP family MFS transporter
MAVTEERVVAAPRVGPPRARSPWHTTVLAGLASYIDAGSIVAGAAGLALWADHFGLTSGMVGAIGAFSSNAISAGVGALISGWLCDRHGRKKIYQWDLLLYAFGLLWIIFAVSPGMLIGGYVLTGLAVGADIPASWTLISEQAPDGRRARHTGMAQVLWGLGPLVVLVMAFVLADLGLLGIKIVFAHLLVVSLVLFVLRRRLPESDRWTRATEAAPVRFANVRGLFTRSLFPPLALLAGTYGIWNLYAGTNGFFLPYILRTVGAQTQAQALALQALGFVLGITGAVLVFMRFADRASQRGLFGTGVALQACAVVLIAVFPLGTLIAIGYVVLGGLGAGFGPQAFFMLWSAESFPTSLRATALGLMFGVVRIALGIWSFFVPALTKSGFHALAWILFSFLIVSGVLGLLCAPSRPGRALR